MLYKTLLIKCLILFTLVSCKERNSITDLDNPTELESSLPRLFTDNTGTAFMSWVEQSNDTSTLYYSTLNLSNWTPKSVISSSKDWFINWADYPSLIAQDRKPIAAHWLNKVPGNTYSYNVEIATYSNATFLDEFIPHSDNTPTEHGFVSMSPVSDSTFYAIWLDGRNTGGGHDGEHGDLSSAMTLRGALINTDGSIINEEELDDAVCDCCNTSIVRTKNGLIAAYRNRTNEEIRDIYVKRLVDGVWESAKPIHNDKWKIAACPVNGPSIDALKNTVAVAWFTGANEKAIVKLSFSSDLGDTFSTPFIIDSTSALGRIDLALHDEKSAWVSWISRSGNSGQFNLKRVSITGETLNEYKVSEINPSRGSGFPQITKTENHLVLAWTELQGETKSIKTSILEL